MMYSTSDVCIFFILGIIFSFSLIECQKDRGNLLLTPLIEQNRLDEAHSLSYVRPLPNLTEPNVESYSGFITVHKNYPKRHLFFWYFPAMEASPSTAPVILWLSGGPGWSTMNALFLENGPFIVDSRGYVLLRNETWTREFNVIFLDQPAGTGFSYVEDKNYTKINISHDIVADQIEFLRQFFILYKLDKNDFYICGQSYGGKYTTDLAAALLKKLEEKNNAVPNFVMNLKGITIGNGFIDIVNIANNTDFMYTNGILTYEQKQAIEVLKKDIHKKLEEGNIREAISLFDGVFLGYLYQPTLLTRFTGFTFFSNLLYSSTPETENPDFFLKYLGSYNVRKAIHVGYTSPYEYFALDVVRYMYLDMPRSVRNTLFKMIYDNDLKIMVYSGDLDLYCPYVITETLFQMNIDSFVRTERKMWKVLPTDSNIAGYVTEAAKNVFLVKVRGGGHSSPADRPRECHDMITRFIKNIPF